MSIGEIKVLLCDESMFARKKLKEFLLSVGVKEVYEAGDGEAAVESYKENKPTVVFMDIIMPKKTGLDALKEIISIDKHAKVIMASSVGTQNHLKDAISAGAYDFLQKPIEDEQILKDHS